MLRTLVIVCVVLATAGYGHAATVSRGFATGPATSESRVACATNIVPGRAAGLFCAWASAACKGAGFRNGCYDGRAVVELLGSGRVRRLPAGNDVLLAIDRQADDTLANGATWSRGGFSCARTDEALTCRRSGHGFTLSSTRLHVSG